MLSTIKAFTDVANYIKELKNYLSLRNVVLYNDATGFTINVNQTVNNIHKYKTFYVYENTTNHVPVLCFNDNGTFRGSGQTIDGGFKQPSNSQWILSIEGTITANHIKITAGHSLGHYVNDKHGVVNSISSIKKIVGIEPIIPDALAEYIRGGVLRKAWRWSPC